MSVALLDGASLPRKEKHLVNQPRDTVHLDKFLNVDFFVKTLLSELKLLVAVDAAAPPVLGAAAGNEAATAVPEAGYKDVGQVTAIELLPLLHLGS